MDGGKFVSRVEKVFGDFKRRRIALIKAFTNDFDDFYQQCDPGKQNLTLHGHPNKKWEVRLPTEMLPSELPEPTLGINFARDAMEMKNWLSLVAIHSDSWLLSVAYFKAAQSGFDKEERERLFDKINNLSTLFDIVDTEFEESTVSTSTSSNCGKSKLSQTKKKTKAECQDTRSSSLRQALADRLASHLKDLKLNTMSYQQDMNLNLPASESEAVSESDKEQSRIKNVGNSQVSGSNTSTETTGKKRQKKKQSKVPGTSQSESSASVVRDLNCSDLASDPTVRPGGPTTFSQASPATR